MFVAPACILSLEDTSSYFSITAAISLGKDGSVFDCLALALVAVDLPGLLLVLPLEGPHHHPLVGML